MHCEDDLSPTGHAAGAAAGAAAAERALLEHLASEAASLTALDEVLGHEAAALRRMDADAVLRITDQKVRILERHELIAGARQDVLCALVPDARTLGAVVPTAPPEFAAGIAEYQVEIRALTARIADQQRRNTVFARAAQTLVASTLTVVQRAHAGARTVYGADARVKTGTPRRGVERRG